MSDRPISVQVITGDVRVGIHGILQAHSGIIARCESSPGECKCDRRILGSAGIISERKAESAGEKLAGNIQEKIGQVEKVLGK